MYIDDFSHWVWGFEFDWLVVRTIYVAYDPNDAFLITNLWNLVLSAHLRRKKVEKNQPLSNISMHDCMHCLMHILYLILSCIIVEPRFMVMMSNI